MKFIFNKHTIFCTSLIFTAACGSQENSTLDIRGGQNVTSDDQSPVRLSTIALTTDYTNDGADSIFSRGKSFCTGTIVGPRTIVTAAHCIQSIDDQNEKGDFLLPSPSDYIVYFGLNVDPNGEYIRAEQVIPHADWSPSETLSPSPTRPPNDIGLIILSEEIPSNMRPVEIADFDMNVNGFPAHLAGYGVTRDRNTNDTGILRTVVSSFTSDDKSVARVSHGAFFQGICAGDSGGPAYAEVNGELQLVGAASTGIEFPGLGCLGFNSNSTDVRFYTDWIGTNSVE